MLGVGLLTGIGFTMALFIAGLSFGGSLYDQARLGIIVGSLISAGLGIALTGWGWLDPAVSLLIVGVIVAGTWGLLRGSVDLAMDAVPPGIDRPGVEAGLRALPGVVEVHDLHIWTVTSGLIAMSAHAIVREPDRHQHVLEHVHDAMRLFGIGHVTVQLERREMYERETHLHP